jgi:hypothetical protein
VPLSTVAEADIAALSRESVELGIVGKANGGWRLTKPR